VPAPGGKGDANDGAAGGARGTGATVDGSPGLTGATLNPGGGGGGVGEIRINTSSGAATSSGGPLARDVHAMPHRRQGARIQRRTVTRYPGA